MAFRGSYRSFSRPLSRTTFVESNLKPSKSLLSKGFNSHFMSQQNIQPPKVAGFAQARYEEMIYFKPEPSNKIFIKDWSNNPDILDAVDASFLEENFEGFKSKAAYPILGNDTEGLFLFVDESGKFYFYSTIAGTLESIEQETIADIVKKLQNSQSLKLKEVV